MRVICFFTHVRTLMDMFVYVVELKRNPRRRRKLIGLESDYFFFVFRFSLFFFYCF